MNIQCIKCKGRGQCGRQSCPIYAKTASLTKMQSKPVSKDFEGSAPAVFVGRVGYPELNVGILTPPQIEEDAWEYDAPRHWGSNDYAIPQLIDLRSGLINSRFKVNARRRNKFLELSQEIGMASKPVDVEINLEDKPKFKLNMDSFLAPTGPNAQLTKAILASNPKVDSRVEKIVYDTDVKANTGMLELFDKGFDENFLSKLLSIGNMGVKKDRRLVPTRWSITAVDDNVGKRYIEEIKDYNTDTYKAYFGSYLGNYYLILSFPDVWSYELFETYLPKASWNPTEEVAFATDYEGFDGRKDYADETAGGYYAARLPILQKLSNENKQASILALRFITGEYYCPLGVWVVREAARKAMMSNPIEFESMDLMMDYAKLLIKKKFSYDLNNILKESILYKKLRTQTKLSMFA